MLQIVLLGFVLIVGTLSSPVPKIVNGTDAKEGEIPYIISLRYYTHHICGGSILDARHVLTAAHCVYGDFPEYLTIQYGILEISGDDTNAIQVTKVVWHEDYQTGRGYFNDVAVLTLAEDIPFFEMAGPTILPAQDSATPGDQDAILAGWGYPYSEGDIMIHLQRVDIICYTDDNCEAAHTNPSNPTDRRYHVCAGIPEGGKGQCSGDSGGPLTVNGIQVGVVSWSVKPCTIKGYPGVFARVAAYVDWIKSNME